MQQENERPARAEAPETGMAPTVRGYLALLGLGLLPVAGIFACVFWAYGPDIPAQKRDLAKAMLWLHAAVLFVFIIVLCVALLAIGY